MKIVLINPYELGRQPFGLAQPAAWLLRASFEVECIDLSLQQLNPESFEGAALIAVHLPMHTATRIALEALPRIRSLAPRAQLCGYGLYGPPNEALLLEQGFTCVLGGECEPALVALANELRNGKANGGGAENLSLATENPTKNAKPASTISLAKIEFLPPRREMLPPLSQYASLIMPDDSERQLGFAEGSRGCKHLCRHCPVVPIYGGKFRIVPVDVVMADVRSQISAGAEHISFGDPDFFNGPTHARRLVDALHREFPGVGYDCVIKIEHLLAHPELAQRLVETGCEFVTTAVEAVDDQILEYLDKGHTTAEFERAVAMARDIGLSLAPTFVPFTPWTTLEGYRKLLGKLVELELVESVPPIQLAIRLLVPRGSRLMELEDFARRVGEFDARLLGYPWQNPNPQVDALQQQIQVIAAQADEGNWSRVKAFGEILEAAYAITDEVAPSLPASPGRAIPRHSEPWYCCAEPTSAQLQSF